MNKPDPVVINIMDDAAVIEQLKQIGYYDLFMAQLRRVEQQGMKPDAIIRLKLLQGSDVYYFSYHNEAADRGYLLTLVKNSNKTVEAIIDDEIQRSNRQQDQLLYVDVPEMRN